VKTGVSGPDVVRLVQCATVLTKHGNSWIFQRRLSKALDLHFRFATIRIRLGEVSLKEARRFLALRLGAGEYR
jgi:hypothetical protein